MNPYLQLTNDAQEALNQFSSDFDAAFVAGAADQWASQVGIVDTSGALKLTYPIPIASAGYRRRVGDDKLRTLGERSLSMTTVEWYDGVEIEAIRIEAPDFFGWGRQPELMAKKALELPNTLVATMLHANPLLDFYSDKYDGGSTASAIHLFAGNLPVNIFNSALGVFDNDHSITALNKDTVSTIKQRFANKLNPDGGKAGLRWNAVLVPSALIETFKEFFELDQIATIVTNKAGSENVGAYVNANRHKGTVQIIEAPDLLDDNVFYPLDITAPQAPWVLMTGGTPEEIVYDKSSDRYKDTGKVGVKRVLRSACSAALPHAIERITITG